MYAVILATLIPSSISAQPSASSSGKLGILSLVLMVTVVIGAILLISDTSTGALKVMPADVVVTPGIHAQRLARRGFVAVWAMTRASMRKVTSGGAESGVKDEVPVSAVAALDPLCPCFRFF
jgi:hypothetical protein